MPEGTTLERMRTVTDRAIGYVDSLDDVEYVQNVTGSSPRVGTNQGRTTLTVILKSWKERKKGVDEVMRDVQKEFYNYPEIRSFVSRPPVIPGLGSAGGVEMKLQARSDAQWDDLIAATDTFMYYAEKLKLISNVSSSLQSEIPQLYFDVDRDQAMLLGVPMSDIFSTMKAYLGSVYVNDFNMFNRIYKVYIQADQSYRATANDINLFFVKTKTGDMVPLTALGKTSYTTGPGNITRFNMYTSASMQVTPSAGHSSGQVMNEIQRIAKDRLPDNIAVAWSGLSFQEQKASGQTGVVLGLVFLFVFLFLAALYESWTVPISVLLSLPIAALGAFLGIWVLGLDNDIYFQIGLVALIGLAAKNAILIVEFAKEQVDAGMQPIFAAMQAAKLRFRPILMTSLAFVLGMLPMVIASGPGSASRHSIGTGVFFGMIVAITFGIILVPFFFVLVYKFKEKLRIPELKFPKFLKIKKLIKRNENE
jgi:multidrug efflux pump subunit AcrB